MFRMNLSPQSWMSNNKANNKPTWRSRRSSVKKEVKCSSENFGLPSADYKAFYSKTKLRSVACVRERTIPTQRPPLVGEVSAKLLLIECCVVSTMDPYGCILDFLDRNRYYFFQVAPQLYSRGRVDPVPDPLLLTKFGSAGNRTRSSGSVARNCDH
jgi:hypothetical protein